MKKITIGFSRSFMKRTHEEYKDKEIELTEEEYARYKQLEIEQEHDDIFFLLKRKWKDDEIKRFDKPKEIFNIIVTRKIITEDDENE